MSRAARLLDLLQTLRERRRPVSAAALGEALGVSLRTVYRDIETLRGQGAAIEGEAGLGYVLKPGFTLPPLMFDDDELDALILGLRLVMRRGDGDLEAAAEGALAKIVAVLPEERERAAAASGLLAGPVCGEAAEAPHLGLIRRALQEETKLRLAYRDKKGAATDRVVWPIAVGFFEGYEMLAAWCETRRDFRHFRLDRIGAATALDQRIPKHRRLLLAEWRAREDLDG
ncbi:DeoR family transcriptional regulator [Aureimonas endophytica]|uniref:DeoR family transcriptional regulator n=1 Tax=Aureimonas endophytica TaxID=2027858 RepID=A0A916ZVW1_9HYPH|nr:YafY family protein [Aureimonas endophytica]GGE16199.1 DeoR family transcriptional regulator [Aureimonas endophytica]